MFTVENGRLLRNGSPFLALGVNYQPSEAGCRIWADWDPATIHADFGRIAAAGLNTVRLFVIWRDLQPSPEKTDAVMLDRISDAVRTAGEHGLACVVSLFTIWMNGQLLDLAWRNGRDVWRDSELLRAEEELARSVAGALRGCAHVLAYDLGDELWNIDRRRARSLTRAEVADWQTRMARAIREESPGALVLQANDLSGTFGSGPYGIDNSAGLDLVGTHGFPVWAPGSIESTMSYKATNLTPFLTQAAGAFGAPLVDELGSYGVDEEVAAAYLRASTVSALANGATGVLVWCWQDIASCAEPYRERPAERTAGLHRLDGTPKPAMRAYQEILAVAGRLRPERGPAGTALYLPERMRGQGDSYLDAAGSGVAAFYAYLLLKRSHLDFDVVSGQLGDRALVICPSVTRLTLADLENLTASALAGAVVYLSLGDHLHAFPGPDLVGAMITDYTTSSEGKTRLHWGDREWPLDWDRAPGPVTTLRTGTADVLATYTDGSPAVISNRVGRGRFVFTNAPVEAMLDSPGRLAATGWQTFYLCVAEFAGVAVTADCPEPDVEIVPGHGADAGRVLAVNHGDRPVRTEVVMRSGAGAVGRPIALPAKGWAFVTFGEKER
ncbi:Cellulase (glycosyl hydrolase family 5) [Sinosporangium album]|uniref:Cellulase (Glycosyl hydrolase family 5) n=1 Tax=Sinosporangium album TaxID=504805 RepID=A0A1G8A6S8_9ACTN|nr:cellulase family glycosylhydrolase [Sinosporangium album]SDH16566.1 Cellulase (glycosyl hydrolase family 5) [Sinosporangium album]